MKHYVDIENWERKDNYRFMRTFHNSWYSVTSEIDCTSAYLASKKNHTSFFIRYLYAILRAANEIRELSYRHDNEGRVCWFDQLNATVPIAVPGMTFYTALVEYQEDYDAFYKSIKEFKVPEDATPFGVNEQILASGDMNVINISATPKLYFTSMTYTYYKPGEGGSWPLLNVGKAVERGDKWVFPLAIYVDHAFVDGGNISDFMELVQKYME